MNYDLFPFYLTEGNWETISLYIADKGSPSTYFLFSFSCLFILYFLRKLLLIKFFIFFHFRGGGWGRMTKNIRRFKLNLFFVISKAVVCPTRIKKKLPGGYKK